MLKNKTAIGKQIKLSYMKNSTEACLFVDCYCQNALDTKLGINCTSAIGVRGGVSLYFPRRFDNENFMDFDKLIEQFVLVRNNFKSFPDETFKNLRIGCLELRENRIELLKQSTFRGIKQLNRLLLVNERKLKKIEKDTFLPVRYLLLELDMSFNDLSDSEMDEFSLEITKLKTLQQLTLNHNKLTVVRSNWFANLTSLDILNLGYNRIKQIEPDGFSELRNIQRISLNNNKFIGYFDQKAFESTRSSLVRLNLANNMIKGLPVFGYLEKLRYLDLSNNSIELVETNTFALLFNLYSLDLNDNFISKIEKNAFSTLANLCYLKLKNNNLSKLPEISKLTSLAILDITNQNGNLIVLNDYQFERATMPSIPLEVNMAQNDITNFRNRVFCSHNYQDSQLDSISVSFRTFSSLIDSNHCVLTQLKSIPQVQSANFTSRHVWTQLDIVDSSENSREQELSLRNYCNCDLALMFQHFKLNVTGLKNCDLFLVSPNVSTRSTCSNYSFIDTCASQSDFLCNPITTTTLVTTKLTYPNSTSKHSNPSLNLNNKASLSRLYKSNEIIILFICCVFMFNKLF